MTLVEHRELFGTDGKNIHYIILVLSNLSDST